MWHAFYPDAVSTAATFVALALVATPVPDAARCFGGQEVGPDAVLDQPAVDAFVDRLVEAGPTCGPALLSAFEAAPMSPLAEVTARAFGGWGSEEHLPALYAAFGRGMLQPFSRHEGLSSGTAKAIAAILGPSGDYLETARRPELVAEYVELARLRYLREWEVEFEGHDEPDPEALRAAVIADHLACLDDPADLPPDPFDPLGLNTGPLARLSVATRCASRAVLATWTGPDVPEAWASRIGSLRSRYGADELAWLGLVLERAWGQGSPEARAGPPGPIEVPIPPQTRTWPRVAGVFGLLALVAVVVLVRLPNRREWGGRLLAVGLGLGAVAAVEGIAAWLGVPPGDESRPLPGPRLELDDQGQHHRDARSRFFRAEKPPGVSRVVVVGASSVQGPGLSEHESLPGALRGLLKERVPCLEVVNGSHHGVASPTVRTLAIDAVDRLHADVVVVYAGHNEVGTMRERDRYAVALGPWFGVQAAARRTRLWTLVAGGLPEGDGPPDAPEIRSSQLPDLQTRAEPFLDAVRRNFEREMTDLLRALRRRDVPVVLVLPGFNHHGLRVPAPRTPLGQQVADALEAGNAQRALELSADLLERADDVPTPWLLRSFAAELAGDLEEAEFAAWQTARANHNGSSLTPGLAGTLEELGRRPGVTFVDAHRALHEASGAHLPGFDLFTDYVHLNPRGAEVVGRAIVDALDASLVTRLDRCTEGGP